MAHYFSSRSPIERIGHVVSYRGLTIIANGPPECFVGELCDIIDSEARKIMRAEVIGFHDGRVYLMPHDRKPIHMGYRVRASGHEFIMPITQSYLGQVLNAFGEPLQNKKITSVCTYHTTRAAQINPLLRQPINEFLPTGIHALDMLLPLGKGQRVGLFAGSGVGKSTLLLMLTEHIETDVNIVALIGERGREVAEFVKHCGDKNILHKTIIVAACSDESAVARRQAAYTATTLAEYFCRQGKSVMLFMDSITRWAMAQREIGISMGEPPTTRGYTPSVFTRLPELIERCGNMHDAGSITAIYTVLVEGDDFNEPLADHLRALLDGHIILTRELAQQGHYPAISILQSISRLSSQLLTSDEQLCVQQVIAHLALHHQFRELLDLGAYKAGQNPQLDDALTRVPKINHLLRQRQNESITRTVLMQQLQGILA